MDGNFQKENISIDMIDKVKKKQKYIATGQ